MEHRESVTRRTILHWLTLSPAVTVGWLAALASDSPTRAHAEARSAGKCLPTGADMEGPFYLPGAPHRAALALPEEPGVRLIVRGRVVGPDCTTPVPGALLDLWQADANGEYHGATEQYRLRGRIRTSAGGAYEFLTVRPGPYRIGGRFRPAHIHFTVTRPGHQPLTSQLYFKGDPYLAPNDACGEMCKSDDPGRIIDLRREEKIGAEFLGGTFDIVLKPAGA